MNLSFFFILKNMWGGGGVFVLSFVLSPASQVWVQQATFCILLVKLKLMLPPDVGPVGGLVILLE